MDIFPPKRRMKILSELLRKGWHFFAGIVLFEGYTLVMIAFGKQIALVGLTVFLLAALIFEHIRLEHKPKLFEFLNVLFRKKEMFRTSSMVPFMIGALLVFSVFPYGIALFAVMILVIGDTFAAGFGMVFGKKKIWKNKTYVGSFAGLLINLFTGFVVLHEYPEIYIPMAITGSVVETITSKVEDNLFVPIAAGVVGYIMQIIYF
ncbi:MAG TPA: hypothetical protein PK398_00440 [Candidatus Gracilibacteria bacterium]|nr:hypothetical protein [Candidatus Gracilibacteria bacterium]